MQLFLHGNVTITHQGEDISEVTIWQGSGVMQPWRKVSATEWVNEETGEIREVPPKESRGESLASVRASLKRLRGIINANVTDPDKTHWVTLTYAENMTDAKRLYKDYKDFWLRFKRYCTKEFKASPEYIAVVEPQARGAWHLHVFFLWSEQAPFIENHVLAKIWGHGFVSIKKPKDVDNMGAYFSAYLSDLPLEESEGLLNNGPVTLKVVPGDAGTGKESKMYVKGARLKLYPSGMNLYRCSREIRKPSKEVMDTLEYEKKKGQLGRLTYSEQYSVEFDKTGADGKAYKAKLYFKREYYNKRRGDL